MLKSFADDLYECLPILSPSITADGGSIACDADALASAVIAHVERHPKTRRHAVDPDFTMTAHAMLQDLLHRLGAPAGGRRSTVREDRRSLAQAISDTVLRTLEIREQKPRGDF